MTFALWKMELDYHNDLMRRAQEREGVPPSRICPDCYRTAKACPHRREWAFLLAPSRRR